jgi:hypothetical protein
MLAYNPKTRQVEDEPILHVWIHTDNDLVDLTLTTKTHAPHSIVTTTTSEVIHTNKKHPFFTEEQGFVPVGQLKLGMHVLRADGRYGVITGYKLVPGAKTMYNLEVQQDHTFTVGAGQWVVHNSDTCGDSPGFASQERLTDNLKDIEVISIHHMLLSQIMSREQKILCMGQCSQAPIRVYGQMVT